MFMALSLETFVRAEVAYCYCLQKKASKKSYENPEIFLTFDDVTKH